MEFQQDWPKDKTNYSSFNFLPENLEEFRSTELYGTALEGSTFFLCRSSLGCTSMFCLEGETQASQIWPTLRKSYTISTLSKSP